MVKFIARAVNYIFGGLLHKNKMTLCNTLDYLERPRNIDRNYADYIRLATLEMVSSQINDAGLPGNVAELGVYKGKFARYINQYHPLRKLYLMDTFEGFHEKDIATEREAKFSSGTQNFSNTSEAEVLQRMPHPQQCVIVKGFFPESAAGIDDEFVFVSLDTDLFDPIYNGLSWFYPRLVKGGYIFVHDFNNDAYKGAREAVVKFCNENNIGYVPLPDSGGSAIITK
jgi:O-methyltransferase